MSSDSGTVEETEEPQQVVPEPSTDQRETPSDPEPGLCTPQTAPVETSQLVSAQSQVVPTCDEATVTSESCSTSQSQVVPTCDEAAVTSESCSTSQSQVVPTCDEATVTSESCSTGQSQVMPTHHEPAMTSKSLPPSSRANPGKDSDFQPGETSETLAFHQPGASADQPIREEDQEIPVTGAWASDSSQSAARTSEDFVRHSEDPVLVCVPDTCLEELVFEDPYRGNTYTIPRGVMGTEGPQVYSFPSRAKGAQKKVAIGKGAVLRHPSNKSQRAQENYGQQISSQLQNIRIAESSAPSGEGSHETQVVSGGSSVSSHSPLASRQSPESVSDSPEVKREHTQEKSDLKDQSSVSQKKPQS